ncbi:MAG: PCMD domain-containing protein [Prevotella sp.]|nr:PCMD domain-containing protein [Prevotella sp.]
MKKLFTLLLIVTTAVASFATDYNVPITITVNGVSSEQNAVISVTENGGLYDINLKNFILQAGNTPTGVGNVELKGIKPIQDGNATLLLAKQNVKITKGDDPNVSVWMGTMIGEIPVELRGKIEGDRLRCYLDISLIGQVIKVAIGNGYQIANQSFENWHTSTDSYQEPNAWHSFETATGDLASAAGHHIEASTDAHSGSASARIFATEMDLFLFKVIANGTMTTGRMNAGSPTAADATGNYAYADMSKDDLDGNGDPFYTPLCSKPDSIATWVKFKQGTANAEHPYATISAIITDGTRYQDPEATTYTNVVAKAKNNEIATTNEKWKRISIPFEYTQNTVAPKAILVTISTNADAGQGSGNDEVLVDDIELIYNAKVTGLKIKGQKVSDFKADQTEYTMELNEVITADDIEATVEGKAAHIIKQVEQTEGGYACTIQAIGGDMKTTTSYVVNVKSNATGIDMAPRTNAVTNNENSWYTLDGRHLNGKPTAKGIYIHNNVKAVVK